MRAKQKKAYVRQSTDNRKATVIPSVSQRTLRGEFDASFWFKEDSDVDVCVEMKPNLFKQAGVKVYLQELLGCSVDVVRLRENMNQLFKQQILKYGVRVY